MKLLEADAVCDDLMVIHVVTLQLLIASESTPFWAQQGESSLLSGTHTFKFVCLKKAQPREASLKPSTSRREIDACPHP